MSEGERRSAKLHKQPEVEDDEDDGLSKDSSPQSESSEITLKAPGGVPTPTVQSASSSSETSPDESKTKPVMPPPITRKQTLIRTQALDGTSPPPESFFSQIRTNGAVQSDGQPLPNGAGTEQDKGGWKKGAVNEAKEFLRTSHAVSNDSGRGTMDNSDGTADIPSLSRDSSVEASASTMYKDSSGVDLIEFFKVTLHKSPKDRKSILAIEKELVSFVEDKLLQSHKFVEMNPYDRMLVHRLSAYLGLDHNVDQSGKCIIVSKTALTRIPPVKLSDLIDASEDELQPKKKILLKKPASLDEKQSRGSNKAQFGSHRAKSLEERQQIYSEARERIFKAEEGVYSPEGTNSGSVMLTTSVPHIHQQRSLDSMQSVVQSTGGQWSSTDSSGYDSMSTTYESPPSRPLLPLANTPTGSLSDHSQVSRSSSDGQSPMAQAPQCPTSFAYLVSSDYSSIPEGSLIINPHTMQPHVNVDGSLYRFDPSCPPPFMLQPAVPQTVQPVQPSNVIYQNELTDLSMRFANTSVTPVEGVPPTGVEPFPMGVSMIPAVSQPQASAYSSAVPQQLSQAHYYNTASSPAHPVRYVTYPVTVSHGPQQIMATTPTEGQSQTTVPMPSVGLPGYQLVGTPSYQSTSGPNLQCMEVGTVGSAYPGFQNPAEVGMVAGAPAPCVSTPVQAYTIAPYGHTAVNHPHQLQHQQPQSAQPTAPHGQAVGYSPVSIPTGATYYTVPVSHPNPPSPLSQPPPPAPPPPPLPQQQHHQQQQQQQQHHQQQQPASAVFYNPSVGNMTVTPVRFHIPVSDPSSLKTISTPNLLQPQFRPATPPQQQPSQHQQTPVTPTNGIHNPAQVTLNYGQAVTFASGQPLTQMSSAQGSQFMHISQNPYQMRPTVIQLPAGQGVASQQAAVPTHVQPYQLVRPTDMRMLPSSAIRTRLSLPVSNLYSNQPRPRGTSRQGVKRGGKKSGTPDQEDSVGNLPQPAGVMGSYVPGVAAPAVQPHLPSAPSNRQ